MNEPLLKLSGMCKSYPGVQALKDVDFDLESGEVHFLLGENGAGKSSLMKILSGSVKKDCGIIQMEGKEIHIGSPQDSVKFGIAMVYQELSLFPNLTVAENIFAGALPENAVSRLIDWEKANSWTKEILSELNMDISPTTRVNDLGIGARQMVEIAKVLARNAKVLLLDEPTSALTTHETEKLFQIINELLKRGIGIIYVSHKLVEIKQIAHRVTVLRDGSKIGTLQVSDTSEADLIRMMVGREVTEKFPKEAIDIGETLFRASNISLAKRVKNVSFDVKSGEILGIFGLMGAGRTSLARAIFGIEKYDCGEICIRGTKVKISNPRDAIKSGVGYVTEERKMGLVLRMGIAYNITFPIIKYLLRLGIINHNKERTIADKFIEKLNIITPHMLQLVENLSGGNQQKVALARWMCCDTKVLIMDEPTRGIDVGAKVAVYKLLGQLAREGAAIIVMSSELPEILGISDRILVMAKGEIVGSVLREDATADAVMAYAAGGYASEGSI